MFNYTAQQNSDVVVYPRVSSEDQQDRETIESQIEFAIKYCELHNLNIIDWYKDDGVTGTIPLDQRPEGKRMLEDAKAGKFKTVLIYNMKRLGRKARVTLDAIYQLEEYGVKIKSMTEPFDTGDPMGRFIITVLAGQAEFDRDTLLETLWHGANRVARLGKWLGGIVPYGYIKNAEGFLELDETPLPGKEDLSQAGVVRLMFDLIGRQGWSTIKVAEYFNALKIPPSYVKDGRKVKKGVRKENTAGVWRPGRIGNMIKNETYMGLHKYGKRATRDRDLIIRDVAAIVSEDLWMRAQQTLRDNQLEGIRNAVRSYLLRGLIKCDCCGLTYIGTAYNHGTYVQGKKRALKAYYVCSGKTVFKGPIEGRCPSKNLPAFWIENLVWSECVNFIRNPGEALKQIDTGIEEQKDLKATLLQEKLLIFGSINSKESEKQNILKLYRQKFISAKDVENQLQEIVKETSSLELRIKEIDRLLEQEVDIATQFETAEELLLDFRKKIDGEPTFEVKREIIKTLVRRIEVITQTSEETGKPEATVNVHYSFAKPQGDNYTGTDS